MYQEVEEKAAALVGEGKLDGIDQDRLQKDDIHLEEMVLMKGRGKDITTIETTKAAAEINIEEKVAIEKIRKTDVMIATINQAKIMNLKSAVTD